MEDSLDCPVCMTRIRPDQLKAYGICYPHGHTTCESCCKRWIEAKESSCPVCRTGNFCLQTANVLANKLFGLLAATTMFDCKNCTNPIVGSELVAHEATCIAQYDTCPMCKKRCLFETLETHECKFRTIPFDEINLNWNFVFDFYNTDFTPLVLHCDSNNIRLTVTLVKYGAGVKIFVYSLNRKECDPLNLIQVTVEIATDGGGPLGRCMKRKINYSDSNHIPRPNMILPYPWIKDWVSFVSHYECKCGYKNPHARISIKILEQV